MKLQTPMQLIEERGPIQLQVWTVTEHLCLWCREAIKGAIALFTLDGRAPLAMLCEDCLKEIAAKLHSANGSTIHSSVTTKIVNLAERPRALNRAIEKRAKTNGPRRTSERAHLNEGQVRGIKQRWANGEHNQTVLAREFGCSPANINMIVTGRTWKHVKA